MALRGVYKKTGIVDNPVPLLCFWSDLWILYHILCISILGGYGTDVYLAFSFHFFLIQIYYFVISQIFLQNLDVLKIFITNSYIISSQMALSFLSNFIYLQSSWTYGHTNVYKFNNCFKFKISLKLQNFQFKKKFQCQNIFFYNFIH